ncbi:MAG: hypothetical protein ABSG66_10620 [Stellaceae bacterium]|jgi:hypothetical protein
MRRLLSALALLLLLQSPASAAGQFDVTARFNSGGNEFDFAQYTEIGSKDKIAVIGIAIGTQRTSVAFDAKEWGSFAELWQKAKNIHAATWQPVGTFKETGTTEAALLTVAAGPGTQFTIAGAKGPFTFVLMPVDYPRFDAAVKQMTDWTAQ